MNVRVPVPPSLVVALLLSAALLAACTGPVPVASPSPATAAPTPTRQAASATAIPPTQMPTPLAAAPANPCGIAPIVVPTPAPDPGYTRLDPSTNLHMTGNVQLLDPDTWRLKVTGKVGQPQELSLDQIRCLPRVQASPDLVCPGFFVDNANWAGAPIADVLALVRPSPDATQIQFIAGDGYVTTLSLESAADRSNFLAYEWNGEPLPRLHGFPLRVVIPAAQGNQWTKWVVEMRVQ
jgi:DMSO/TMAO reductase YedYZ molybdopterin-dependent catalytic subunit